MSELILDDFGVTEKNGVPVVSSRKVAGIFEKRHDNVLRDIEEIKSNLLKNEENIESTCRHSENNRLKFWEKNFLKSSYKDNKNRRYPEYLLTRDGFTLLAMGFTGEKALRFKIAYINRFNEMERFIQNLYEAKAEFPEFTDAILSAHEEPKHYHFSNECDMINSIVLGMTAKKYRELHGIAKGKSIRPYLTLEQIEAIKTLQRIDIGLILAVPDFQQRKQILKVQFDRLTRDKLIA